MVLNTYFVVPGAADKTTTFSTLQGALNLPSFKPGDVVQIEPGSSPGHILDADIPNVQNLTIQGDPAADQSSIPYFFLDDHVSIDTTRQGFTFKRLQFDITTDTLQFLVNATIADCHVKNDSAGEAIEVDGPTAAVISDSYFESSNQNSQQTDLLRVYSPANSHNRITDNQFVALTGTYITLLDYTGAGAGSDLIAHNTFNGQTGGPLLAVHAGSQGLTVQGNTFNDGDSFGTAVQVVPNVQNLQIVDNVISFSNGSTSCYGIGVLFPSSTGPTSMVIADNHIHTDGNGEGIQFNAQGPSVNLDAKVQDNDLTGNGTGVYLAPGAGGSLAGIDLGGGALGSKGANNFRGDFRAIVVEAFSAAGPIQAQMNIFGVADPTTVIDDQHHASILAAVVATNPLTGNAAYVETLFLDFLHRTGDLSDPHDAGGWVTLLGQGTSAAAAASGIARSPEGLGVAVGGLYHRFLGRDAAPSERDGLVGYLQAGGTLEGVSQTLLASAEYQARFPSDPGFVQSLFPNLLHRTGSTAEVGGWVAALPQLGRSGVAQQLLSSQEFRDWEVGDDYAQLLHRAQPPSAAEVGEWVGGGLDILAIDALMAASAEFQQNG
jgi:hypothetical protein